MAIPKLIGGETEYNNFFRYEDESLSVPDHSYSTNLLLSNCPDLQMRNDDSFSQDLHHFGWQQNEFLSSTGARMYSDHGHTEYSTPEVLSAHDFVATVKAGDLILNNCRRAAIEDLGEGKTIVVLANNIDGSDHTSAGHFNILVSRETLNSLFDRGMQKTHRYLIPHLVSCQVFAGGGKVGADNGCEQVDYQISQRADFMEQVWGQQTTYSRPIFNTRDEPLCDRERFGRLHISGPLDTNRQEHALFLKAGTLQLVLAMIEDNYIKTDLALEDPVVAIKEISGDLTLKKKVRLENGKQMTALEIQKEYLDAAAGYVEQGKSSGVVPQAEDIIKAWKQTLFELEDEPLRLVNKVDWIAKLFLIRNYLEKNNVSWFDPSVKVMDLQYSNIDPEEGLYDSFFVRNGLVERIVSDEEIIFHSQNPPLNTRAFFRAICIRRFGSQIKHADWDNFRIEVSGGWWPNWVRVDLNDPFKLNQKEAGEILDSVSSAAELGSLLGEKDDQSLAVMQNDWDQELNNSLGNNELDSLPPYCQGGTIEAID